MIYLYCKLVLCYTACVLYERDVMSNCHRNTRTVSSCCSNKTETIMMENWQMSHVAAGGRASWRVQASSRQAICYLSVIICRRRSAETQYRWPAHLSTCVGFVLLLLPQLRQPPSSD